MAISFDGRAELAHIVATDPTLAENLGLDRAEARRLSGRGGRRPGAGRRPTGDRPTTVRSYTLDDATLEAIAAWHADPHNNAASASEALRQMVDTAMRVTRGLPHPCPSCGQPMQSWKPGATCVACRNRKGGAARHKADSSD